jgi:hypothetical protein
MTITLRPTVRISGLLPAPETEMIRILRSGDLQRPLRDDFTRGAWDLS